MSATDHLVPLSMRVRQAFSAMQKTDVHTHLYPPGFGDLCFTNPDLLLTYHYLVCEYFRPDPLSRDPLPAPKKFLALNKARQAELIWQKLFLDSTPLSEATRGVVFTLNGYGIGADAPWKTVRKKLLAIKPAALIDQALCGAGLSEVVGTNDPLDPNEQRIWAAGKVKLPSYYCTALRLDSAILAATGPAALCKLGYAVKPGFNDYDSIVNLRRYLRDWQRRMKARYMAISLPPTFDENSPVWAPLLKAVLPTAEDLGIPVALMMGVERQWNSNLGQAGDGVGVAKLEPLRRLASMFPNVRIWATVLSTENEYEFAVICRKFGNIIPFGGWWWRNSRALLPEIVRMRLSLLGCSWIGNNSDARHWLQLPYKWHTTGEVFADELGQAYSMLRESSQTLPIGNGVIADDLSRLFGRHWLERSTL